MNQSQTITEEDIRTVMDEVFYTSSGAMKMMGIGRTCLSSEIKKRNIAVFKHPECDLFSKEAIKAWMINRTVKAKK